MNKHIICLPMCIIFAWNANALERQLVINSDISGISCTSQGLVGPEWNASCTHNGRVEKIKGIATCAASNSTSGERYNLYTTTTTGGHNWCFCKMIWPAMSAWIHVTDPYDGTNFSHTKYCMTECPNWCATYFADGGFNSFFETIIRYPTAIGSY